MTSDARQAYVWIWLPGAVAPVVAGKLTERAGQAVFNYGRSYLAREDAMAVYAPELPLRPGLLPPPPGLDMPSCIRDAAPDAWGRRVIVNRMAGLGATDTVDLDEWTYLLESGSDRIGALDFQTSPTEYRPRLADSVALADLQRSAERVMQGVPLSAELDRALMHGTSVGGARPKAMIEAENRKYIAKLSLSTDVYDIVKTEFVAMRLARRLGLDAAQVHLDRALDRDVLLVERFDRIRTPQGWSRKAMVSALTILGESEMTARYAGYEILAEAIRYRFAEPSETLRELYGRMVFNVLCGNTDDHARNHAAFWDGRMLRLTPAYDICPQLRTGNEAGQAMRICGNDNLSRISNCLKAAPAFLLSEDEAAALTRAQVQGLGEYWGAVCDEAGLGETERRSLWGRQFLNPYAFEDLTGRWSEIKQEAERQRRRGRDGH